MKKFLGVLFVLSTLLAGSAFAIFPQDTKNQALLGLANARDPYPGIGNIINWAHNMLRCTYSFAVQGGATGTVNLTDDQGNTCALPKGAIATSAWLNVTTAVTGGSNASIGAQVVATNDLLTTVNNNVSSTYGSTGFYVGHPVPQTPSTFAGPVTAQAGSNVTVAIGTAALTAGVFELFIDYVIQ